MKKLLLTLTLVATGASVFAQGTIAFVNSSTTQVRYGTASTPYGSATNAPAALSSVELLWAEVGTPVIAYTSGTLTAWLAQNPGWTAVPASVRALSPAGRFNGGGQTVQSLNPGAVVQGLIAGWYVPGTAQGSFDAAYAAPGAYVGFSSLFTIDTGNPLATPTAETPTALVGALSTFTTGFSMTPVPEPSTFALAGLGAAAMLIFRRRK